MSNRKSMHSLCNTFYYIVCSLCLCVAHSLKRWQTERELEKRMLTIKKVSHTKPTHDIALEQSNLCVMECERVLFV